MTELKDGEAGLTVHGGTTRNSFTNGSEESGNGPRIVSNGGSAQIKDIMKLAEETWGGLWAVEAEDLPRFTRQKMPLITEDEVRRVVNNLADGKTKGID
eukprot:14193713-Heterocapsa_arctica.AAC.1